MELDVLETELLPSDVIKITFYRPPNFTYRSGQWIRVSCNVVDQSGKRTSTSTSHHQHLLNPHLGLLYIINLRFRCPVWN